MCLLCSLLRNKSNKGQGVFGNGLFFMMQNVRNREKPPHRFLLYTVPPPTHLATLFAFLSLSFELWEHFPACFCQSPLSEQQLHGSVHVIILCWKTTSLMYLKSAGTLLARKRCPVACLLFHLLRQVVWWDTAELAAWLPGTARTGRLRNPPLSWKGS